jgi:outer membrane protein TolC
MSTVISPTTPRPSSRPPVAILLATLAGLTSAASLTAQQPQTIALTLERMVELTLSNSFEMRFLNLSVEQTQLRLQAERAGLRSSVTMDVSAPDFQSISETQWNSQQGIYEIAHENSRRWEAQLSIRQPIIIPLLGYPTNGYLSLNNRVYRYSQLDEEGERDLTYYNRYFVRYTQPLFQPNELKNNLEEAELDLESAEMDFYSDVMEVSEEVSREYLELFENAYDQRLEESNISNLERALAAAQQVVAANPARSLDLDQIRVELANARENLQRSQSQFRRDVASLKTDLNLPESTEITLDPVMQLEPIQVDLDQAIEFARRLTPRLREIDIDRREGEIQLDETRGRNGFRMNVEFTYGREMQDPVFRSLWNEPSNTYTVDVNASIPIWDWGQRRARIQAEEINLRRNALELEQTEAEIVTELTNEVRNIEELQSRVLAMQDNLTLARGLSAQSLEQYRQGAITVADLLLSLRRETDTASNFLEAYVSWRESIQELQQMTYYDFERGQPVMERYGIDTFGVRVSGTDN